MHMRFLGTAPFRRLPVIVAVALLALAVGGQAGAANGDPLGQIIIDRTGTACASYNPAGDNGSVGVGVAFDGTNLLASCYSDNTITAVSPLDGSQVVIHPIAGASSLGALAWDSGRNVVWGYSSFSGVGTIDLTTNTFTYKFSSYGCFDGLAYDASDDTIWASDDVASSVQHWIVTGGLISSTSISGMIGGCGNSGIAVGGPKLYLGNNGCSQIYEVAKDFSTSTLFAGFPRRIEDMECDDVSFASSGKGAIWSIDAYDNVLNAWEIPAGSCSFGGGGGHTPQADLAVTKTDNADPISVGDTVTYTITVTNNGPDAASNVTVTDTLPGAGAMIVAASPGCLFTPMTVTCTIGALAVGGSATVTVTLNATAAGTLLDSASVAGTEADPVAANNSAAETTLVLPRDRVAPVLGCTATTKPAGKVVPPAWTNPQSGQNPDGFYLLSGSDNVDATVAIMVVDSVSGATFGPFAAGTKIKLVQAPGAVPSIKPGAGVIAWMITIKGDAIITATDAADNTGTASCRVPPTPK